MGAIPDSLLEALSPVTVVVGHYGTGKTNFTANLALDLASRGCAATVIDLDIVNPYFRISEKRSLLEERGVRLIAPIFAEAGTSLDVPSLSGQITPAIQGARDGGRVIIDSGGDDAGAGALGRFAAQLHTTGYSMLYVMNRFRNLVQDPADALENLREIEAASHLRATAIVNNSHLKEQTTEQTIEVGSRYADEVSRLCGLPVVCTTVPARWDGAPGAGEYAVDALVKTLWE